MEPEEPRLTYVGIMENGGALSVHEKKKRKQAKNMLQAFERDGGEVLTPQAFMEIGIWAMFHKTVPLRKSSWDTIKPHVMYHVAARLGMTQKELQAAIGDGMKNLNRIARNMLPDAKHNQHARPLMRFDLQNLRKPLLMDCLSPKEEELQAIIELGLLSGARFASIERVVGTSLVNGGVALDCGFKSGDIRMVVVKPTDDTPHLTRFLERKGKVLKPKQRLFPWSLGQLQYALNNLAVKAGYPRNFFGAHSLRRGYVNQTLIDIKETESSLTDAITRVCLTSGWSLTEASQIDSYVDESVRSMFASGTAVQDLEGDPVKAVSVFHGLEVVQRVLLDEHVTPHLLTTLEQVLGVERRTKAQGRFSAVLFSLFDRFPRFEEDIQAASQISAPVIGDLPLTDLGHMAVLNGMFEITPTSIEYTGDGKRQAELFLSAQSKKNVPVRELLPVQIQKGEYQAMMESIMSRRRVKRPFTAME